MNFLIRFFVGYVLVAALAVLLAMKIFAGQLVPGVKQSVEETLLQTANLLAEWASREVRLVSGSIDAGGMEEVFRGYEQRRFQARIFGVLKDQPDLRIFVTDHRGKVVFDSLGMDVGMDYSKWQDVSRTLRGEYGARATRAHEYDRSSSVMYVAAPILRDSRIVGVLSVGKPSRSFQAFIDMAQAKAWESAFWLFGAALLLALGFSYWMTRDLHRLVEYAHQVATGKRVRIPIQGRSELRRLARALEHLRAELDSKAHVERVSQLLAHELKSPIAAISGAVELLADEIDPERHHRLSANIAAENDRLRRIVEGALKLARAENIDRLSGVETIALDALVREVVESRQQALGAKNLNTRLALEAVRVEGDRFLLRQSVANLLDNAIDFSPRNGTITLSLESGSPGAQLRVEDEGPGIPAFAQERLFERFYSVPRPDTGQRSTGLGLNLVQEAARLHAGTITIRNRPEGGAAACFSLPRFQPT